MRDSADCYASIRARRCQLPPDSKLKSIGSGAQELRIDRPPDEFVCPTAGAATLRSLASLRSRVARTI